MELSPKQRQIIDSTEKYMYVIAGAGSGKTRTLTERINKILSTTKQGERVLAITFSNKAANELNERLLLKFSKEKLGEQVYVGTIHNFCMELVLQRGSTIGLPSDLHIFESFEDRFEIFKNALDNVPQMKAKYQAPSGKLDQKGIKSVFESLSKAKRNFKFPSNYHEKPLSQRLYQEYNDLMLLQNAIDFDDILLYAYRILSEKPSVARIYQRIYKYVCVDEAQDLNKAQYEVIKAIAGQSSSIFMVGDPNQAIYGFNGSSSRFMCKNFPQEFNAQKYVLTENFRSSKSVISAAKMIEPSFEMEGQLPIQGEFSVYQFDNEESECTWIVEKLIALLSHGHPDIEGDKITLQQCVVLARNKYVFNPLEKVLKEQGIEYNLRASANQGLSSESVFFKIFDLSLRLLMNKNDMLHLVELLALLGTTTEIISSFDNLRNNNLLQQILGTVASSKLNQAWDIISIGNSTFRFDKVLEEFKNYCENANNFSDDNERLLVYNDYIAWTERWGVYIRNSSIEDRNLAHMMRSIALGVTNISKETGLTLSTVHMSKGLEFDVVFIMGLNEGVFPDYRAVNDDAQLSEEQHNMFVSITRSKRLCYLSYPLVRIMPWGDTKSQKASRYITNLNLNTTNS